MNASTARQLTRHTSQDLFTRTLSDLVQLLHSVTMAAQERAIGKLIVKVSDRGSFLTSGLLHDGWHSLRRESGSRRRRKDAVQVQELEQENEILLRRFLGVC